MRKKTRRKVYALVNPITYAIEGACITPPEMLAGLRLRELSAIDAFAHGKATLREWKDLGDMLNLAETMGMRGIGPEVLPVCKAAQFELVSAAERFERTGKMGLTGPGLTLMRDLFDYHDLQRSSVPRSTYEQLIAVTRNRIMSRAPEVTEL